MTVTKRIETLRRQQPIEELRRKAKKARRKDIFTQEDIDLAYAEAEKIFLYFNEDSY